MALEAIQRIRDAEELAKKQKLAAQEQARELIKSAEQNGTALLQSTRDEASAQSKVWIVQAEESAAATAQDVYALARSECEALTKAAGGRLREAAEFIVQRIVSDAWPS